MTDLKTKLQALIDLRARATGSKFEVRQPVPEAMDFIVAAANFPMADLLAVIEENERLGDIIRELSQVTSTVLDLKAKTIAELRAILDAFGNASPTDCIFEVVKKDEKVRSYFSSPKTYLASRKEVGDAV